jgi:DNA helicase-2/ATP-dependent DNA helicase PcrA
MTEPPHLSGAALDAVRHRDGHLQIIASAGSGKTEVVSQRVADLLADGLPADSVVAFTFTERAASELKNRISVRVEERLGRVALDQLSGLFVGTIHAFCFRFLQQRVPRYETYDVLDDNRLTAFLSREATRLELRQLDSSNRLFASIEAFLKGVDVVENELLEPASMPEPFRAVLTAYYETLDRYRLLTYGQQVGRAVAELARPELAAEVHDRLRHLIVDEYQDVNPAQERLIDLLTGPRTALCVVGDDDQAIYQWRGSDVSNIVTFPGRYEGVATFELTTNRRSRPQIIAEANRFALTIPERIEKTMLPHRPESGSPEPEVVVWNSPDETQEAGWIASLVLDLIDAGLRYRDVAVLVRSRAAYGRLVEQFATVGIPVQPGGRSGLFDQPEAVLLGHTVTRSRGSRRSSGGTATAPAGRSPRTPSSPTTSVYSGSAAPSGFGSFASFGSGRSSSRAPTGPRTWWGSCTTCSTSWTSAHGICRIRRSSTGSARWPGSPRCSPTASRCGGGPGPMLMCQASRSAARTVAPGTTGTSRCTSSTTRRASTRVSTTRPTTCSTRST